MNQETRNTASGDSRRVDGQTAVGKRRVSGSDRVKTGIFWLGLHHKFFGGKESPEHLKTGKRGEQLACKFLRTHGYKILYRNFKSRGGGEIDIVCRDGDTLVFVEVKTRRGDEFGRPIDAIGREKQLRVSKGGLAWLRLLDNPDVVFRFDVVEVLWPMAGAPQCELIQDAFELSQPYIY